MGNSKSIEEEQPPRQFVLCKKASQLEHNKLRNVTTNLSFSNPSLLSLSDFGPQLVQRESSIYPQVERLTEVFIKMIRENVPVGNIMSLPEDTLSVLVAMFETLTGEENILLLSTKYVSSVFNSDELFQSSFATCSKRNTHPIVDYVRCPVEQKVMIHCLHWIRINRLILAAYEQNKPEIVIEILKLVALSHAIMKVNPSEFSSQTTKFIQYFMFLNIIHEENAPMVAYYMEVIERYIINQMQILTKNMNTRTDRNQAEDLARENYRELRKWKYYITKIHEGLQVPLMILDKQFEEARKVQNASNEFDDEPWRINRLLRKGYKYRNAEKLDAQLITKQINDKKMSRS